ncbi:MAG: hypothetical protein JXB06_15135 [Spirochaetales bacterium]|nr:hypothetical protein [Spirochaetales bacterium]
MATRFHRGLAVVVAAISLFHLAVFAVMVYLVFQLEVLPDVLGDLVNPLPPWLLLLSMPGPEFLRIAALAGMGSLLLFAVFANLGVRRLYRRTDSTELLFVMLFCLSLCPEAWRVGNLVLQAFGLPLYLHILVTRVVLFSRVFGLLCLLVASLYAVGMKYTQYPVLIGGMVVLAFTLAGILPLDTSLYEVTFLFKLGDLQGYRFVGSIFVILMTINFLVAARLRRSRRFAVAAPAALLLLAGRELLQYGVAPLPIALGAAALTAGFVVFVRQIVVFYLGF